MHQLFTITWDMSKGLDLGFITLRFYSLLFASGFVIGYFIMKRFFEKEGVAQEKLDSLVTYTVLGTIIGARLGHVFFYQWDYYSQHPIEILKVWEGGLASHGAAIAIILSIIYYSKKVLKKSPLWMLDRLVITVALAACLIRIGNYFNSEIYGDMGNSAMQTVFTDPTRGYILDNFENIETIDYQLTEEVLETDSLGLPVYNMLLQFTPETKQSQAEGLLVTRVAPYINSFSKENTNILFPANFQVNWSEAQENLATVKVLGVPRAPTQLYEALGYLLIFIILFKIYTIRKFALSQGLIFGLFLMLLFGFRFAIEFAKENQVSGEQGQALNIGQMLSIPLVLIGLYFVLTAHKRRLHE